MKHKGELLPCPFCGGEAKMRMLKELYEGDNFYVLCDNSYCLMDIETPIFDTEAEAIEAWNTRAERTGKMLPMPTGEVAVYEHLEHIMHCELCQHEFSHVLYNEDGDTWADEKPNYCPNCGAKVVSD